MGPTFIALLALTATVTGVFAVATSLAERKERAEALAKLESYEWADERDQVLRLGWQARLVQPALTGLTGLGLHFTPSGYREKTVHKLAAAGMGGDDQVDRYLAGRLAAAAAVLPAIFIVLTTFGTHLTGLALTGFVVFLLLAGPTTTVSRRGEKRQKAIAKMLPDVLDLLVISVEAGLGFEQALDRTVSSVPGPLTEEFGRVLGEMRAGAHRGDAMRDLAARVDNEDVRGFVMAVLQADTFGVSIGRMLRNQADEIRVRRRQAAQEKAQKAPVKMLIPMVFCIFPSIFVVIIGPAILNIVHTLGKTS